MIRLLLRWVASAAIIYLTSTLFDGIRINSFETALWVALVFGLINAILKPIVIFFTFPLIFITLGLFMLIINVMMLKLTASFFDGFTIDGWITAILGSIVITVLTSIAHRIIDGNKS